MYCWLRDMDMFDRLYDFSSPLLTNAQKQTAQLEGWIAGKKTSK